MAQYGGYETTTIEKCTHCGGKGYVEVLGQHLGHGRYEDSENKKCATCNGYGLVEITKKMSLIIKPAPPCPAT